jgi:hypothetical protein
MVSKWSMSGNPRRWAVWAVVAALAGSGSVWAGAADAAQPVQFEPLPAPQRIADTRPGAETADGQFQGQGQILGGQELQLQVGGRVGVSPDAAAATLNVTAVDGAGPGFLTVYPCDQPRPNSSNVNYFANTVRSNAVFAGLDPQGRTCIYALTTVHVVVDVNGWLPAGVFEPLAAPRRIADTRPGSETFDGQGQGTGKVLGGGVLEVPVAGRVGVPTDVTAAVLNVTVVEPDGAGFVTVYPCEALRPLASNLNYGPGDVTANSVVAKVDGAGKVCVYTLAPAHLIVDIAGTLDADYFTGLDAPQRLVDSRESGETTDGDVQGDGFRRAGTTLQFPITGRAGIPADATAVALNVTAVNAADPGFLTLHPRNSQRPNASNVNYFAGGVYANTVVAAIGGNGMACLFASSDVEVIVDVAGYFTGTPPVDTGTACPLEFPLRTLWDGYPVGQYQMPPGLYVSENPPPDNVWCEVRRLTEREFNPGVRTVLSSNVSIGRYTFGEVKATDAFVDFVSVFGIDSVGSCDPLVPYVPPSTPPTPAASFDSGHWMVGVHVQSGTFRSSRKPDGGFCVVLVVSSWDGSDESLIARYESGADDSITINVPANAEGIMVGNTCNTFTR